MALSDEVSGIAAAGAKHAASGEQLAAVLAVEPQPGERVYLCAFRGAEGTQSWLALDGGGTPLASRVRVREAASLAALCEVAEESANIATGEGPRLASLEYLESIGLQAGDGDFAAAMQSALPAVDELTRDVEANYRLELV